jgi:cytochrome P450
MASEVETYRYGETAVSSYAPATSLPPGPRFPGLLQGISYLLLEERMVNLAVKRYGDVFTVRMPSLGNVVVISDPALVRQIFTVSEELLEVGDAQQPLEVVYGPTSVLLSDGPDHRRIRRLLVPPLRPKSIERYREIIERAANRLLVSWPVGESFAMLPQMRALSCEIILRVVLGLDDERDLERWSLPLRRMLHFAGSEQMTVRYFARSLGGLSTWRGFNRARAECDALLYEEIARRRRTPASNADDVLGLLLRSSTLAGEPLDDRTLRDQLMTLIVGGHETPASALAWTFERLVRHPAVLERLTAEALAGDEDSYAEAVMNETLRVRPPLSFVARRVKTPFRLGDHMLAPGTMVVPYFLLIHSRSSLYPEPLAFKPERFLNVRPPAYGWVPFGGGAHACLGGHLAYLEIKTVLHTVLRSAVFATVVGEDEPIVRKTITYVPKNGARVTLRARRQPAAAGRQP